MASDKTEKATPKRRQEARERGQVARSTDANTAVVLLATVAGLIVLGPRMLRGLEETLQEGLLRISDPQLAEDENGLHGLAIWGLTALTKAIAPLVAVALAAGLLASIAQVRPKLTPKALKPSFRKLDPLQGLKRVLGPQGLVEAGKATAKTAVVAIVAFLAVWPQLPVFGSLVGLSPESLMSVTGSTVKPVVLKATLALVLIAAVDVWWQRFRLAKSLRMTKDEVRREAKQQDVSPEVRKAIRRKQFEAASRRMLADVPTADVVVTNPTHYAVAIRYDGSKPAPEVIARGVDLVAKAIREVAKEHGVPVLENPPLARALYADVELGQMIPEAFFSAVAEVLAFVYRTSGRRSRDARRPQ
ncbi:MAG: flagellar biosynthesis protein FlhB [Gaiellales bacterium]